MPVVKSDCALERGKGAQMAVATELGHIVVSASSEGAPLYFCLACAARASWKVVKLAQPCLGTPTGESGWRDLRRLKDGKHPVTQVPLENAEGLAKFFEGQGLRPPRQKKKHF